MIDFILSELEDGDDLDFIFSINDNLIIRDFSRKLEKYSDQCRGYDIFLMNNELQRKDYRVVNYWFMFGQVVLRNNDLVKRKFNKDLL